MQGSHLMGRGAQPTVRSHHTPSLWDPNFLRILSWSKAIRRRVSSDLPDVHAGVSQQPPRRNQALVAKQAHQICSSGCKRRCDCIRRTYPDPCQDPCQTRITAAEHSTDQSGNMLLEVGKMLNCPGSWWSPSVHRSATRASGLRGPPALCHPPWQSTQPTGASPAARQPCPCKNPCKQRSQGQLRRHCWRRSRRSEATETPWLQSALLSEGAGDCPRSWHSREAVIKSVSQLGFRKLLEGGTVLGVKSLQSTGVSKKLANHYRHDHLH